MNRREIVFTPTEIDHRCGSWHLKKGEWSALKFFSGALAYRGSYPFSLSARLYLFCHHSSAVLISSSLAYTIVASPTWNLLELKKVVFTQVTSILCTLVDSTAAGFRTQVLNVLAGCSRDAMSARHEHVALVAKRQSSGGSKDDAKGAGVEHEGERDEASPHPGDEGSLRRWEELLRSAHVNGGRWRPGVIDGGVASGECGG